VVNIVDIVAYLFPSLFRLLLIIPLYHILALLGHLLLLRRNRIGVQGLFNHVCPGLLLIGVFRCENRFIPILNEFLYLLVVVEHVLLKSVVVGDLRLDCFLQLVKLLIQLLHIKRALGICVVEILVMESR
jgi:hypothetical protein